MSGVQLRTVDADDDGVRLDRWFKRHFPAVGHGHLQKLLRTGQVRLDGKRVKAGDRLTMGQEVRVPPISINPAPPPQGPKSRPMDVPAGLLKDMKRRILFRDEHILALDKPAGLAVQGGSKTQVHIDGLLDGLRFGSDTKPKLVHRLDKDTSGVLVLARTQDAARRLTQQFRQRETQKLYWALVAGVPVPERGTIHLALEKKSGPGGEKMVASDFGKRAETIYNVVDYAGRKAAWLTMEPLTGRTHQLRVHAAIALETPIIGDGKYGGPQAFPDGLSDNSGMQLHARAIRLARPSGQPILIEAPAPDQMLQSMRFLGFDPGDPEAGFLDRDEEL